VPLVRFPVEIPLSIVQAVAFWDDHVSVEESLRLTFVGIAVKVALIGEISTLDVPELLPELSSHVRV
jgi:hypothetical protein